MGLIGTAPSFAMRCGTDRGRESLKITGAGRLTTFYDAAGNFGDAVVHIHGADTQFGTREREKMEVMGEVYPIIGRILL